MTKSKSSGSYIVVLSIFTINLINDAQFLNATGVGLCVIVMISPITKM